MSTTLTLNGAQTAVINALGTYVYTVNTTSAHVASIQLNVVPAAAMDILIKQNSSTIAHFSSPATGQSIINLSCNIAATASDTISFVLSSAAAIDNQINDIKGIINIHRGSNN